MGDDAGHQQRGAATDDAALVFDHMLRQVTPKLRKVIMKCPGEGEDHVGLRHLKLPACLLRITASFTSATLWRSSSLRAAAYLRVKAGMHSKMAIACLGTPH